MGSSNNFPQSWGRNPMVKPRQVIPVYWRSEIPDLAAFTEPILPYAYGRSYGDSCLNENGILLDVSQLTRFIAFDEDEGILRCEAGVSLAEILDLIVPRGWFLPVSPGTKFVSVGGAIANDIHGKNHYKAGTFGCHVTCFELLRSNGERYLCSSESNRELFEATIGGLGLTGIILWAEFTLKRITNPFISMESIRYSSLSAFKQIADESDENFEYTVAWVDCLARGRSLGRGIFMRGNHNSSLRYIEKKKHSKLPLAVPFDFPGFVLNTLSIKVLNTAYYHKQLSKKVRKTIHYEPFFYPLDVVHDWNRAYGKRGFFQYQCAVPYENGYEIIAELLRRISHSGEGSFVTVFKKFGDIRSPGMLSFPRPGLTIALDFPNNGKRTLKLFKSLDELVRISGGLLYPAKDARMDAADFQAFYPRWQEFAHYIDPKFSSSFWRRVTSDGVEPMSPGIPTIHTAPTLPMQPTTMDGRQ